MGTTLVQDLMTEDVESLHPTASVAELLDLLHTRDIRHVPVVDSEGDLIGLVTHRDLLRSALSDSQVDLPLDLRQRVQEARSVDTLMTREVLTVEPEVMLSDAAALMAEHKVGCLPVTVGGKLVGILTETDLARWVANNA